MFEQVALPKEEEPFIKPWMTDLADDHYALNIRRARIALNWKPRHRLLAALPAMIDTLKSDPQGWYEANQLDFPDGLAAHPPMSKPGARRENGLSR